MKKEIKITIENRLVLEKRDINVYHHSTRSAHMISYNSFITLPLRPEIEDDFVHVSVLSGPGHLKSESLVNLPAWVDFEFSNEGKINIAHSGDRTLLKIPPGLPVWQLKMTRSTSSPIKQPSDRVIIGDDNLAYR